MLTYFEAIKFNANRFVSAKFANGSMHGEWIHDSLSAEYVFDQVSRVKSDRHIACRRNANTFPSGKMFEICENLSRIYLTASRRRMS